MELNDQQILRFVDRIKLPREKKTDYAGQIDTLKDCVVKAIGDMSNTKVSRVLRAGSWQKGTALRPRGDMPLDVDMVFFIDVDEETEFDSEELRDEIIAVLKEAYPSKAEEDFTSGEKTVGIVFRGSGLEVDIVPFIPEKGNSSYGRQPRKRLNSGSFRTSVDKQLDFIANTKIRWPSYTPVVRIIKWWKNRQELELPSFAVELILAHLIEESRIAKGVTIECAIIEFFEFVSADTPIRIEFPGAIGNPLSASNGMPIVADPTNNENNVMEKTDPGEWSEIMEEACKAFETLSYARQVSGNQNTLVLWGEVFEGFSIEEV